MATLLSELDNAIAINAQTAQEENSRESEDSASALLLLRQELAQQVEQHGAAAVDSTRITKLSPGVVLPRWVPSAISSVIGATAVDKTIPELVQDAIKVNDPSDIRRLTNAVSRSISPAASRTRSETQQPQASRANFFSMRTGSSSAASTSKRRLHEIETKRAALAAAKEERIAAELRALEVEESIGGQGD